MLRLTEQEIKDYYLNRQSPTSCYTKTVKRRIYQFRVQGEVVFRCMASSRQAAYQQYYRNFKHL